MSGFFKFDGFEPIEAYIRKITHTHLRKSKEPKIHSNNFIYVVVNTNGRSLHNYSLFLFFFLQLPTMYHYGFCFFLCVLNRKRKRPKENKVEEKKAEEEEKKSEESKDDKESKEESAPLDIVQGTTFAMHEHFKHDFWHLLS